MLGRWVWQFVAVFFAFAFVTSFTSVSLAVKEKPSRKTSASMSRNSEVLKTEIRFADFKKNLTNDLKRTMCEKDGYFRSCYRIDESDCPTVVESHLTDCFKKATSLNVAKTLGEKKAIETAEQVGVCVGSGMEKKLSPTSPLPPRCKDWRAWL